MPRIRMPRLVLVPATIETLNAELEGRSALGRSLGVEVSGEWPPELYDENATRWTLAALERIPAFADWGLYYVIRWAAGADATMRLIGTGGFKGPPNPDGIVEIGYAILPAFRQQGFAREAVDGWLAWAFAHESVHRVIAHTLRELTPSIGVLRSAGFTFAGAADDPDEPSAIRYEITRALHDETRESRVPARFAPL